ncbi:hypothetical protein ACROYT_G031366 [Oculina patagonica]
MHCPKLRQTTFCKPLPLSGEGIVSANIQRRTPFAIRIRSAPHCHDGSKLAEADKDKLGYLEVVISTEGAMFISRKPGDTVYPGPATPKDGEDEADPWQFIFRPDVTKEIVIKDVDSIEGLVIREVPRLATKFLTSNANPSYQLGILISQALSSVLDVSRAFNSIPTNERAKLTARVDVEKKVSFYPHPLTYNWSPLVLDSSKATLPELGSNHFVMSASLPATCQELYGNVASPDVALDWPYSSPRLSDAINYSINTEGKILYEKLSEKSKDGGMSYLRVTLGTHRGFSTGIPYVLEIWPAGSESPIHNHGNAYAVIKVLHGAIKVTVYNKTWNGEDTQQELSNFTAKQGGVTWISPNWFQTHKLTNESKQLYGATIQCYKYGCEEELMWPYFDYLDGKTVKEFLPDSDFDFTQLRDDLLKEYCEDHPEIK